MSFTFIDWLIIIGFLGASLSIGLMYKNKASGSLANFFLAGRNLPWYVAGISMVATTFAADTPLWVTEVVKKHGISGNWLWWNFLIGGIFTTFFFAKLWRRADIVTELEFLEIRYSGKIVRYFRAFKAVYLGVFFNAVIIGWVNAAMIKILSIFLGLTYFEAFYIVGGLMILTAIYSSLSGLLGVSITDALQFTLAMIGCIILAIVMVNSEQIGGIEGLKEKLPEWRFDFFPKLGESTGIGTYAVPVLAFLSFIGVQWWSSWYPGSEPGGGGYVSQRMMSAKNEKQAVFATLFFQIAHYCFRPWPWIIVGLCALVVYPNLTQEEAGNGFVMAMNDFMPVGLKGLIFTAFLGAYMSTISSQLNWGASYLTNDLYKLFAKPKINPSIADQQANEINYVGVGRYMTVLIMLISLGSTLLINSIDEAARFLIAASSGLGLVLILRWYWWRINIWSEISATLAPIIGFYVANFLIAPLYEVTELVNGQTIATNSFIQNEGILLFTTGFTTVIWLVVTFTTRATDKKVLQSFYNKIKPDGFWSPVSGNTPKNNNLLLLTLCWILGVIMTYAILFFIGKLVFHEIRQASIWFGVSLVSFIFFRLILNKTSVLK